MRVFTVFRFISKFFRSVELKLSYRLHSVRNLRNFCVNGKQPLFPNLKSILYIFLELSSLLLRQRRCFHQLIPVVDSSAKKIATNKITETITMTATAITKQKGQNNRWRIALQKSWNFTCFLNTCIEV